MDPAWAFGINTESNTEKKVPEEKTTVETKYHQDIAFLETQQIPLKQELLDLYLKKNKTNREWVFRLC